MPRPDPYSPELTAAILRDYAANVSMHDLVRRHGGSRDTIRRRLVAAGVRMRTREERQHRLPCREDAFANAAESEEAAYWVGMLMTDGCIHQVGHSTWVILVLGEKDADHVLRFRDFLGCSHRVLAKPGGVSDRGVRRGAMRDFRVASRRLAADLSRYGVVPRKTKTAKVVGLEADRHFWRGVVDGDGSVGLANRARPSGGLYKPRPVVQLCGSLELMTQFADWAAAVCGSESRPHRTKSIWGVGVSSGPAVAILKVLYGDCTVALARKKAKADEIIARFA